MQMDKVQLSNIYSAIDACELKRVQGYLEQMSATYRGQPIAIYFQLGRELKQLPPKVPEQTSLIDTVLWSLKFRYYAWKTIKVQMVHQLLLCI